MSGLVIFFVTKDFALTENPQHLSDVETNFLNKQKHFVLH